MECAKQRDNRYVEQSIGNIVTFLFNNMIMKHLRFLPVVTFMVLYSVIFSFSGCSNEDVPYSDISNQLYTSLKKDFKDWNSYSQDEKIKKLSESAYIGYIPRDLSLLGFISGESTYFEYVEDIVSLLQKEFQNDNGVIRSKAGGGILSRPICSR